MLELRRQCERCGRGLAPEDLASICSFESTFCRDCAERHLACACPNMGIAGAGAGRDRLGVRHHGVGARVRPTRTKHSVGVATREVGNDVA
jgi:uncharacterized protein